MALLLVVFAVVVLAIFLGIRTLPKHHPANWLLGVVGGACLVLAWYAIFRPMLLASGGGDPSLVTLGLTAAGIVSCVLGVVCLGVCVWRDPARFWMLSIVFIGVIGATQFTALG
ncbi:hypothetical protein [Luteibacter sp. RCC_6_2]|jgi:hypothetical protein|uniref:hypothetical protein n=1 Tax=unclassified Luteibacter TaxID=2620188 RepID=UPI003523C7E5